MIKHAIKEHSEFIKYIHMQKGIKEQSMDNKKDTYWKRGNIVGNKRTCRVNKNPMKMLKE